MTACEQSTNLRMGPDGSSTTQSMPGGCLDDVCAITEVKESNFRAIERQSGVIGTRRYSICAESNQSTSPAPSSERNPQFSHISLSLCWLDSTWYQRGIITTCQRESTVTRTRLPEFRYVSTSRYNFPQKLQSDLGLLL